MTATLASSATDPAPLPGALVGELERIIAESPAPGAYVAAIGPGVRGVWTFGRTSTEAETPVGPATAFQLCSLTKSYVALLALLLQDEGRLSLDDFAVRWAPELQLTPSWLAGEVTLRDLLSNRLGLARGGLADFGLDGRFDVLDLARRMGAMKRAAPFRTRFSYCNPAFTVAALALSRAAGVPFDELLQTRVTDPLGMTGTGVGHAAWADPTRARAHTVDRAAALRPVDEADDWARPGAGGISSPAQDQLSWLDVHINRGRFSGRRLWPEALFEALWTPHVALQPGQRELWLGDPDAPLAAYGLGWFLSSRSGHLIAAHSGGGLGWRSKIAVVPDAGVGVCVAVNADGKVSTALLQHALDRLLGRSPRDWSSLVAADRQRRSEAGAAALEAAFSPEDGPPPASESLAGAYSNPESGRAWVHAAGAQLRFELEDSALWSGALRPLGGTVYELSLESALDTYDGPDAPRPRLRFAGAEGAELEVSGLGRFVRSSAGARG